MRKRKPGPTRSALSVKNILEDRAEQCAKQVQRNRIMKRARLKVLKTPGELLQHVVVVSPKQRED